MKNMAKVEQELMKIYSEGEVKGMRISNGYSGDSGLVGWHYGEFDRRSTFIGKSLADVKEYVREYVEEKGE